MQKHIDSYKKQLMNQTNTETSPKSYPENFNGFWMPWLDKEIWPPAIRNPAIWSPSTFCEGYLISDPRNCL